MIRFNSAGIRPAASLSQMGSNANGTFIVCWPLTLLLASPAFEEVKERNRKINVSVTIFQQEIALQALIPTAICSELNLSNVLGQEGWLSSLLLIFFAVVKPRLMQAPST